MKTKTPIKAPIDPTIVLIFCLFMIYFPFMACDWYYNIDSGYFYKKKVRHFRCIFGLKSDFSTFSCNLT